MAPSIIGGSYFVRPLHIRSLFTLLWMATILVTTVYILGARKMPTTIRRYVHSNARAIVSRLYFETAGDEEQEEDISGEGSGDSEDNEWNNDDDNLRSPHNTSLAGDLDCQQLFAANQIAIDLATHESYPQLSNQDIERQASDCPRFLRERRYVTKPVNKEEADFPLAYSIITYKEADQVEVLLRAIYRPQNVYCIHVDRKKNDSDFYTAMTTISACFPNVFVAEHAVSVKWGTWSVVECELVCMRELLKRDKKWKYFINLTGQEFPLKTNLQMVQIIKAVNGSNIITGSIRRRMPWRVEHTYHGRSRRKDIPKPPPPVNVTLTKGPVHIVAKRAYVDYLIHDERALKLALWMKTTGIPDESFFNSLNHSPQLDVPGAYRGYPIDTPEYPMLHRLKYLSHQYRFSRHRCHGKRVRGMCVFGVGDLPVMKEATQLFVNKLHIAFQPAALKCMDELHQNRTRLELTHKAPPFSTKYYSSLEMSWNHNP